MQNFALTDFDQSLCDEIWFHSLRMNQWLFQTVKIYWDKKRHVENVYFYWYLICKKKDIQKWLKTKMCSLYWEFGKEQKKGKKTFLTFRSGELNSRFSVIFLPKIWIFTRGVVDKIKWIQPSKRRIILIIFYTYFKIMLFFNYRAASRGIIG